VALGNHGGKARPASAIGISRCWRLDAIRFPMMWKHNRKCRTASLNAFHVDPAPMRFDNRVDYRQP
jgi:hypothetical protein